MTWRFEKPEDMSKLDKALLELEYAISRTREILNPTRNKIPDDLPRDYLDMLKKRPTTTDEAHMTSDQGVEVNKPISTKHFSDVTAKGTPEKVSPKEFFFKDKPLKSCPHVNLRRIGTELSNPIYQCDECSEVMNASLYGYGKASRERKPKTATGQHVSSQKVFKAKSKPGVSPVPEKDRKQVETANELKRLQAEIDAQPWVFKTETDARLDAIEKELKSHELLIGDLLLNSPKPESIPEYIAEYINQPEGHSIPFPELLEELKGYYSKTPLKEELPPETQIHTQADKLRKLVMRTFGEPKELSQEFPDSWKGWLTGTLKKNLGKNYHNWLLNQLEEELQLRECPDDKTKYIDEFGNLRYVTKYGFPKVEPITGKTLKTYPPLKKKES